MQHPIVYSRGVRRRRVRGCGGCDFFYIFFRKNNFFLLNRPFGPIQSISRFVRPCVCPSVCSLLEVPFKRLFAPTSQCTICKLFRDSESLGKSNVKKGSRARNFLLANGLKSLNQYFFVFWWFSLAKHGGNHASWWIRDISSKTKGVFDEFLGFSNKVFFLVFLVQLQCIVDVLQWGGSFAVAVLVMTSVRWHVTGDTWHVTLDRWQVKEDRCLPYARFFLSHNLKKNLRFAKGGISRWWLSVFYNNPEILWLPLWIVRKFSMCFLI